MLGVGHGFDNHGLVRAHPRLDDQQLVLLIRALDGIKGLFGVARYVDFERYFDGQLDAVVRPARTVLNLELRVLFFVHHAQIEQSRVNEKNLERFCVHDRHKFHHRATPLDVSASSCLSWPLSSPPTLWLIPFASVAWVCTVTWPT